MKNLISSIFTFLAIVSIIVACNRREQVSPVVQNTTQRGVEDILLDYYNLLGTLENADGYVKLRSFRTFPSQQVAQIEAELEATFLDNNRRPVSMIENLWINDEQINNNPDFTFSKSSTSLRAFYGNDTEIKLKESNRIHKANLYVPKEISAKNAMNSDGTMSITANKSISWNQDDNNSKGVLIILTYDPKLNPNLGQSNFIERMIGVPDIGSYTFSSKDLEGIPANSVFDINIIRANFMTLGIPNLNKVISIYAYTSLYISATNK